MNRATYPNACPSHLRSKSFEEWSCLFIMRGIGNNTTCSHSYSCWMENLKHYQRIKPEPHGGTLTTTAITMVVSMLDKLKEARVINSEARRYNHVYEYPLTALLTMFSIILAMLNGGIRCLHDDACLYDLV